MIDVLYDDVVVNKPWGHEYLMFRNQDVALWCLFLKHGERTSLHCHPRKKTGFVVLSGSVTLRFLNNANVLTAPANVMIRAGLFHQSIADLGTDVVLIEVETPVDKMNLVRLADNYGRESSGYETIAATRPLDTSCLRLPAPETGKVSDASFFERVLRMHGQTSTQALVASLKPADVVVILEGGLFAGKEPILAPGDVVSAATLSRLSAAFEAPQGLSALVVTAAETVS